MRIAYVTIHVAPEIMEGGVGKKIHSQMKIWRELGHQVSLFSLTPAEIPFSEEYQFIFQTNVNLLKRELNRASSLKRMLKTIQEYKPDIIYLRFGLYSYPLHRLFKIAPVILETNSDDRQEYQKRGFFFYWINRLTRDLTFGSVSGIICPSYELVNILVPRQDKPYSVISNGIDLTQIEILPPPQNIQPVITMACSPGMKWHGVDKLIKFAEMYSDVTVNIVGYSQKDINVPIPANLKLWGFLNREQVRDVLAQSDVACGSLALHRNQMKEASVLKIREALGYGIPVIIAFHDTDLHDVSIDTILQIPNEEDNVEKNAGKIYRFVKEMMGQRVNFNLISNRLDQKQKEINRLTFFKKVLDEVANI